MAGAAEKLLRRNNPHTCARITEIESIVKLQWICADKKKSTCIFRHQINIDLKKKHFFALNFIPG